MVDSEKLSNKTFENNNDNSNDQQKYPIKKCHFLEGNYFIVLADSICEKLQFSNLAEDLHFQQEVTTDGNILLRKCILHIRRDQDE